MNAKLYVGNLLYEVTDEELRDLFSQAGNVASAQVIRYRDSGRSKGFGFVEMASEEEAKKAIEMFHGQDHHGRKLVVSEARPPQPRQPGQFRNGGRRRFGGGGGRRGGFNDRGQDQGNDMGMNDQGNYDDQM